MEGYVESDLSDYSERTGRCITVIAEITANDLHDKQFSDVTGFETFVQTNGVARGSGFNDCDDSEAAESGRTPAHAVSLRRRTTARVYATWFFDDNQFIEIDAIAVASTADDTPIAFEPVELQSIPS